ncbi:MAG: hypothetical protein IMW93_08930 [Thermoanaerobacteraceae bacterium]|nr:hypothetical protein [Thermoanaerobacteraceae bacterium]
MRWQERSWEKLHGDEQGVLSGRVRHGDEQTYHILRLGDEQARAVGLNRK